MFTVLIRRSWLVWGPSLVAGQIAAAWAVDRWATWQWLRDSFPWSTLFVSAAVALWFIGSIAVFTKEVFLLPFAGCGYWREVVARNGSLLTLRVGDRYGNDTVVSLERVQNWPALERVLAKWLLQPLPGPSATEPHPDWRKALGARADELVARAAQKVALPPHQRSWLRPDGRFPHRLTLAFAPAENGRHVTLTLGDDWYPEVLVDAHRVLLSIPDSEHEYDYPWRAEGSGEDDDADDEWEDPVALMAAVFGGGRREPVQAWRIVDEAGRSWDFYPLGSAHEDRRAQ